MKKKFAVIGLGHFGLNLCVHLTEKGAEVLGIDVREERVELLRDRVAHAMILDSRDLRVMRTLGLEEMDAIVVAIGEDFEASILTTANLQEIGVKKIINRVVTPVHEKLLKLMKIHDMILPESEAAYTLAQRLTMTGVLECLELDENYSIAEVAVPRNFIGKTVAEVELRKEYRANLVTVVRKSAEDRMMTLGHRQSVQVLGVPTSDFVFSENDILVVFATERDLEALGKLSAL